MKPLFFKIVVACLFCNLLALNGYAQAHQKITGKFVQNTSQTNSCPCSTPGMLIYQNSMENNEVLSLCFDTEPGSFYEIFEGEIITVEGSSNSVACANGLTHSLFYVQKSDLPAMNRKELTPANRKAQNILPAPPIPSIKPRIPVVKPQVIPIGTKISRPIRKEVAGSAKITSTGVTSVSVIEAQAALDFHNAARKEVGVGPMTWSIELAKYAQEWANYLAANGCDLEHRPSTGKYKQMYGENIFWGSGSVYTAKDASESWYDEKSIFQNVVLNENNWYDAGHYSQMIWKKSTQIGIGIAVCPNGEYIIVANYNPAGNYMGEKAY